jgi:alpha-glucosidase
VSDPPDVLIDAMQTGDRLSYHPERGVEEIAHFHEALPKAQAAIKEIDAGFAQHLDDYVKRLMASNPRPPGMDLEKQKQPRLDAAARADRQVEDAGK